MWFHGRREIRKRSTSISMDRQIWQSKITGGASLVHVFTLWGPGRFWPLFLRPPLRWFLVASFQHLLGVQCQGMKFRPTANAKQRSSKPSDKKSHDRGFEMTAIGQVCTWVTSACRGGGETTGVIQGSPLPPTQPYPTGWLLRRRRQPGSNGYWVRFVLAMSRHAS